MNPSELHKFDLTHPGHWIVAADRDWAWETSLVLEHIESEFIRAAASYAMFEPITLSTIGHLENQSRYERCLNGIYATAFVYSLDSISKLLSAINDHLTPPDSVRLLISEYEGCFGNLKNIRDSIAHIEDRGRGLDRNKKALLSHFLVLGCMNERRFEYTGNDGKIYGVEISEPTLLLAHRILQAIINAYVWE
jgi:hypothetical protein